MDHLFYETAEERWKASEHDYKIQQPGWERLQQIQDLIHGRVEATTNVGWEFINLNLPQLVWQNPSLMVETRIPGEPRIGALGLRYTMESLMARQGWNMVWEQSFADALAWRGATMVTTEDVMAPRYAEGLNLIDWRKGDARKLEAGTKMTQPRLHYISPEDFFVDGDARDRTRARRMGHTWTDSIARLRKKGSEEGSDIILEALKSAESSQKGKNPDSIRVRQMFVPNYLDPEALDSYDGDEKPLTDGLHTGTIYTMICGASGGSDVRKPRLYRGPACGPYQLYDCIPLPGDVHRGSPLGIVYPQIDRDARTGTALSDAAKDYKVVNFATEAVVKAMQTTAHNGLLSVGLTSDQLKDGIQQLIMGGVTRELIDAKSISGEAVDRTLGMSDTQRGIASAGTTATAEELANRTTDIKIGMIRNSLHRQAEGALYVAAWHILHAPEYYDVLPDEARQQGLKLLKDGGMEIPDGMLDADGDVRTLYTGGDALSDDPLDAFDAMMVKIAPMSMERTSEGLQQRRAMGMLEMTRAILEMQAQFPGFDGKETAKRFSAMMNMPGLEDMVPAAPDPMAMQGQEGQPLTPDMTGRAGNQSGGVARGGMQ